jgi:polysaccharide export outer membrane protein
MLAMLAGCALERGRVEKNLMADKNSPIRSEGVADHYLAGCPDVLDIRVAAHPEISGKFIIGPDGRIELGQYGNPRVEGRAPEDIERLLAEELQVPAHSVTVRVAEFNSQSILIFGEVVGLQRAVPYRGQETVLDLLQRVGGITAGAAPDDVYVVRTHVPDGRSPEVFHIKLASIVVDKDPKTNIRLMPFDQVYVGETRQSRIERCIPGWLRPVYQRIWRTRPEPEQRAPLKIDERKLGTWKRAKASGDTKKLMAR